MSRTTSRSSLVLSCLLLAGLFVMAGDRGDTPAVAQDDAPTVQNIHLQAIGGLIAGYAHTSYALVGTTADCYGNQVYDAERVKALMDETRAMQRNIIRMLRRLQGTALTREDDDFIDDAVNLFKLIDDEATLLVEFTAENDPEVAKKFEEVRLEIGRKMARLFGGEAPPETADGETKPAGDDAEDAPKKEPASDDDAEEKTEKRDVDEDVDEEN